MWFDLAAEAGTPRAELVAGIGGGSVRSYPAPVAVNGRATVFLGERVGLVGTGVGLPLRGEIKDRFAPCLEGYTRFCPTVATFPSDEPTAAGALSVQWAALAGGAWVADEFPMSVRVNLSAGAGVVRRVEHGFGANTWEIPAQARLRTKAELNFAPTAAIGLDFGIGGLVIGGEARAWVWRDEPRRWLTPGDKESPWGSWLLPTIHVGGRWSTPPGRIGPRERPRVVRPEYAAPT